MSEGMKMSGKLYKIYSQLKRILKKHSKIWELIERDYSNALKIQMAITTAYEIMREHHTNMEYIFVAISKSYEAIIKLGKYIKEGKRTTTNMRVIETRRGMNLWDTKLKRKSDNQDSNKITRTGKKVHHKMQYQNQLIRETSSPLYTKRKHLKHNLEYTSMIGSNSKVPKIKNSLGEARRYVLAGVDMEEAIKAILEKTENQLSNR